MKSAPTAISIVAGVLIFGGGIGWRTNPRQLTSDAMGHWSERTAEATRMLETAHELVPQDPYALYNVGTARLASGEREAATAALYRATDVALEAGDVTLAADALYNAGTAALQWGRLEVAIGAFEETLRLAPDHLAAKHNLEVALRYRDLGQRSGPTGTRDEGERPSASGLAAHTAAAPSSDDETGATAEAGATSVDAAETLPRFAPQRDLSREQAAALLEAIEALERQQRRRPHRPSPSSHTIDRDW